ncbi:MAG: DUF554 domain-containing protein [Synergistales bacterium]|nr:DUF554 domain-containing protein [Synergistales bacterium]
MDELIRAIPIFGTIVNALAIVAGGTLGLLLHKRFPKAWTEITFQGIGLFTIVLGIRMAISSQSVLILVFSIVVGGVFGAAAKLEDRLNTAVGRIQRRFAASSDRFVEGVMTPFLLFCTGSMTILGAIEEGLGGFPNLLLAKSLLDGMSSIAFAASLGAGVLLSAVPLLLFQGGITLFAAFLEPILTEAVITEVTAVGGLMLLGLGLNIMELKTIRVLDMLPSLVAAGVLASLFL